MSCLHIDLAMRAAFGDQVPERRSPCPADYGTPDRVFRGAVRVGGVRGPGPALSSSASSCSSRGFPAFTKMRAGSFFTTLRLPDPRVPPGVRCVGLARRHHRGGSGGHAGRDPGGRCHRTLPQRVRPAVEPPSAHRPGRPGRRHPVSIIFGLWAFFELQPQRGRASAPGCRATSAFIPFFKVVSPPAQRVALHRRAGRRDHDRADRRLDLPRGLLPGPARRARGRPGARRQPVADDPDGGHPLRPGRHDRRGHAGPGPCPRGDDRRRRSSSAARSSSPPTSSSTAARPSRS